MHIANTDKFYAKIKTAFNGDDSLAKKNMDVKYKEKAVVIADGMMIMLIKAQTWPEIYSAS